MASLHSSAFAASDSIPGHLLGMSLPSLDAGEAEAVILISPARPSSIKNQETVFCAGVMADGTWVRLYPDISAHAEDLGMFRRWSRIRFKFQAGSDDLRPEHRQVDHASIRLVGELPQDDRHEFLCKYEVSDLKGLSEQGKNLALLRPQNPQFFVERKTEKEMSDEKLRHEQRAAAGGNVLAFDKPKPYKFKYRYSHEQNAGEGVCEGSEINTVFSNLSASLGEPAALAWIMKVFGKEYIEKGVVFAVTTDAQDASWQINAIICMDEVYRTAGHHFDVLA